MHHQDRFDHDHVSHDRVADARVADARVARGRVARGRRVRFAGAVTLTAIGAYGISACGLFPGETFTDDAAVPEKITTVRLDTGSGGVTLRGGKGGGKVAVHRSVTHHGDRPEGATHRVEGGVLVLGGCGKDCSVTYTVDLPAGLPVSGETTNGAVRLTKVGKVDVTTGSGDIDLDGVAGTADVRTSNGRITGHGLSGGGITARTSNGEIDLSPATPQSIRAETSNGAITVKVPKAAYRVTIHTDNGDKNLTVPNDPSGRFHLDLTTSNGSITAGQVRTR
ncbi:DUF4097 family beta strand repeat-containing protein [Streptomyces chattanoogensis]|uniref:DUF4097 family beta strand repeat-containing protein n=1 Tax=Streptomyces chattanoogensis TaxID=66876 RepID=UPI00368D37F6